MDDRVSIWLGAVAQLDSFVRTVKRYNSEGELKYHENLRLSDLVELHERSRVEFWKTINRNDEQKTPTQ